jgi:high-affinity Fe2+/Pb2+ permease
MERRPLDVVLIAIYYAGFSAVLVGIVLYQWLGGHIHGSWQEKIVVVPGCLLLGLLPGVLATGLWMFDSAARIGAIVFALLPTIAELAFLSNPRIPSPAFTVLRIVLMA